MLPFDSFVDEVGEYLVLSHIAIDEPSAFRGVPPKPWICPVQVLKGSWQNLSLVTSGKGRPEVCFAAPAFLGSISACPPLTSECPSVC